MQSLSHCEALEPRIFTTFFVLRREVVCFLESSVYGGFSTGVPPASILPRYIMNHLFGPEKRRHEDSGGSSG